MQLHYSMFAHTNRPHSLHSCQRSNHCTPSADGEFYQNPRCTRNWSKDGLIWLDQWTMSHQKWLFRNMIYTASTLIYMQLIPSPMRAIGSCTVYPSMVYFGSAKYTDFHGLTSPFSRTLTWGSLFHTPKHH